MEAQGIRGITGGLSPVAAMNAGGGRYFAGSGMREDLRQAAWGQVCIASRGKVKKRLRGLSPSCAFAVFALPFRDIYAVMMMVEARQSEGALLKFEA